MRYYFIYHELAHDVLNLDDLSDSPENEGKLMYPAIASYESKTMDNFIESSYELFEEIAAKQKKLINEQKLPPKYINFIQ